MYVGLRDDLERDCNPFSKIFSSLDCSNSFREMAFRKLEKIGFVDAFSTFDSYYEEEVRYKLTTRAVDQVEQYLTNANVVLDAVFDESADMIGIRASGLGNVVNYLEFEKAIGLV